MLGRGANDSFDSIWSWLASPIPDDTPWATIDNQKAHQHLIVGIADDPSAYQPLAFSDLEPLTAQMQKDYSCADRLYLLPGSIPFPSFDPETPLPATEWVSPLTKRFRTSVARRIASYHSCPELLSLLPIVPFPPCRSKPAVQSPLFERQRRIIPSPLIVRHPSSKAFSRSGRSQMLSAIGVPSNLHDRDQTKILIVSFGGQKFRKPSSTPAVTPAASIPPSPISGPVRNAVEDESLPPLSLSLPTQVPPSSANSNSPVVSVGHTRSLTLKSSLPPSLLDPNAVRHLKRPRNMSAPPSIASPTHIFIPGAPGPVTNPTSPLLPSNWSTQSPVELSSQSDSPAAEIHVFMPKEDGGLSKPPELPQIGDPEGLSIRGQKIPQMLPKGWIAIICGASPSGTPEEHLPDNLFLAPRDVYMPDLMVIGDVLLGKLGYGTVSEAIDSSTPFIYGR